MSRDIPDMPAASDGSPPRLLRTTLLSGVVWIALASFGVMQMYLSRVGTPAPMPVPQLLAQQGLPWLIWWAATPLILLVVHRARWERSSWGRAVLLHAALGFALGLLPSLANVVSWRMLGISDGARSLWSEYRALLGLRFLFDVSTYAAIAAVATGFSLHRRAGAEEARRVALASELSAARLNAMTAQIHPHFLFNALNAVAMLIRAGEKDRALSAVIAYGDVLRSMMDVSAELVTVREEFQWLRRYLEVEALRFPDDLETEVIAEEEVADALVPRLLLQPLVENALRHGVAPDGTTRVGIRAGRVGGRLWLLVRDNGPGVPPHMEEGIGLRNVRARLAVQCGAAAELRLRDAPDGGCEAEILIPLARAVHSTRKAS